MGQEDIFHKQIAEYLNLSLKDSDYFWTYMPFGEKRTAMTGALLKRKGTKRGVPDFMILKRKKDITTLLWLEAKCGKNKQSEEQIDFEEKTKKQQNEHYFVVKDLDDVMCALQKIK